MSDPATIERLDYRHLPGAGPELFVAEAPGEGPPLILLHGIGSRHVSWWPVLDALASHFRLLILDLRGHGESDKPPHSYLFEDYAADLAALVDHLEIERPLILGHSLGAMTALTWAVDHPTRAAGIGLEDPPLRIEPDSATKFDAWAATASLPLDEVIAQTIREYPHWSPEECRRRAESITATTLPVYHDIRAAAVAGTLRDRIGPFAVIQSPTLLIHGDLDTGGVIHPTDIARFAATFPHAQIVRIPGAGHSLHRDHTEDFLAAIIPFLERECRSVGASR